MIITSRAKLLMNWDQFVIVRCFVSWVIMATILSSTTPVFFWFFLYYSDHNSPKSQYKYRYMESLNFENKSSIPGLIRSAELYFLDILVQCFLQTKYIQSGHCPTDVHKQHRNSLKRRCNASLSPFSAETMAFSQFTYRLFMGCWG